MDKRASATARTRQELLGAAASLFAEKGYANTTIAAIAQRAQLSAGTVYTHFESKEELLRAVIDRTRPLATLDEDVAALRALSLEEFLTRCAQLAVDETRKHAGFLSAMAFEARDITGAREALYHAAFAGSLENLAEFLAHFEPTRHLPVADHHTLAHLTVGAAVFMVLEQDVLGGSDIAPLDIDAVPAVIGAALAAWTAGRHLGPEAATP